MSNVLARRTDYAVARYGGASPARAALELGLNEADAKTAEALFRAAQHRPSTQDAARPRRSDHARHARAIEQTPQHAFPAI